MTPSTIVRRPRGPITFAGLVGAILDEPRRKPRATFKKCVAVLDDGRSCELPARYVNFEAGGHVCFEHRPPERKAVCV